MRFRSRLSKEWSRLAQHAEECLGKTLTQRHSFFYYPLYFFPSPFSFSLSSLSHSLFSTDSYHTALTSNMKYYHKVALGPTRSYRELQKQNYGNLNIYTKWCPSPQPTKTQLLHPAEGLWKYNAGGKTKKGFKTRHDKRSEKKRAGECKLADFGRSQSGSLRKTVRAGRKN